MSYQSNDTNAVLGAGQLPSNDVDLEFRTEHTFESGAVYKGQWLGDIRHGYGV